METQHAPVPPTFKGLLSLAWPMIITRSAQAVIGFADAIMVGQLGEAALAATTTGALNTFNILVLPMGVCFIVSSFASQFYGQGDNAGVRRFGLYGLAVAGITQLLCLGSLPVLDDTVALFGFEAEVGSLMTTYLQIRLLSGGAAIGLEALGNMYGGVGNTRLPMIAQVIAMVLNVVLNWVLIYGHLGAPAMGVAGAAWASTISTWIAFAFLITCFLLNVGMPPAPKSSLSWVEFRRMLRFGLPSGFNWFIEFAAFSFFVNVVLTGLGTSTVAATMAVMQLNSIAFMPAFALSSAGAILVGQAIGQKQLDDVPRLTRMTLFTTVAWQSLVGLMYLSAPTFFIAVFVDAAVATPAFLAAGARVLMLSAAWQVFDATAISYAEALRAAGDTAFTFWTRALVAWLVFVPGSLITVRVFDGGEVGATVWMVIYLAILAVVLWRRFQSGRWRSLDLTGKNPENRGASPSSGDPVAALPEPTQPQP